AGPLVDPVDAPVEADGAAVGQSDGGGVAGLAAETECQLPSAGPGHDPEPGADHLVGVEEPLELAQDAPPVELPEQWSAGQPFGFSLVAVALRDREQECTLVVAPRLVR